MKEATRVDQGKKTRGVVQVRSVEPRSIVNPACPACAVRAAAKIFVFCPRNQHVPSTLVRKWGFAMCHMGQEPYWARFGKSLTEYSLTRGEYTVGSDCPIRFGDRIPGFPDSRKGSTGHGGSQLSTAALATCPGMTCPRESGG